MSAARRLPITQVDAFADRAFTGNPAAVMPLEEWLDDAMLHAIAAQNNLADTAFLVPDASDAADHEPPWVHPTNAVALFAPATPAPGRGLLSAAQWRTSIRFREPRPGLPPVEGYAEADRAET